MKEIWYKGRLIYLCAHRDDTGYMKVWLHSFLRLALDGGGWCTSRSIRPNPGETTPLLPPCKYGVGVWVDHTAIVDVL